MDINVYGYWGTSLSLLVNRGALSAGAAESVYWAITISEGPSVSIHSDSWTTGVQGNLVLKWQKGQSFMEVLFTTALLHQLPSNKPAVPPRSRCMRETVAHPRTATWLPPDLRWSPPWNTGVLSTRQAPLCLWRLSCQFPDLICGVCLWHASDFVCLMALCFAASFPAGAFS